MNVHIVNLAARKDRLIDTVKLLHHDLGIQHDAIKRFDAIDTRNFDEYQLKKEIKNIFPFARSTNIFNAVRRGYRLEHYEMTKPSIGCFLSHCSVWRKIVSDTNYNENDPQIIVEDDLCFQQYDTKDQLKNLVNSKKRMSEALGDAHIYC